MRNEIMEKNKEKVSLLCFTLSICLSVGIFLVIAGTTSIFLAPHSDFVLIPAMAAVLGFFFYRQLVEHHLDEIDEMAKEHFKEANVKACQWTAYISMFVAAISTLVNMFTDVASSIPIHSAALLAGGTVFLLIGVHFTRLEKHSKNTED